MTGHSVTRNSAFLQSPSPGSRSEAFEIDTLDQVYSFMKPTRRDQVVEMIWITKGRLQLMCELETYEASPGMVIFLTPGQNIEVRSTESELDGFVIRLSVGLMPVTSDLPYPNVTNRTSRIFEIDDWTASGIMHIIQLMRWELRNVQGRQDEVLSGYLTIVLIYLFRQPSITLRPPLRADISLLARRFFDLLERQYHVNKKVSEYADELAVSPNYLNQIVKQETGVSASANIRKRLLLQAKRMAHVQGVSMKTVAYELGFNDTAHFSKFFKIGCGCNFTDYRKMITGCA